MNEAITYKVRLSNLTKHLLTIECSIPHPNENGQLVYLPSWVPGSYLIRDFAKNVVSLSAHSSSGDVKIVKLQKNKWQCEPCTGPLIISYQVYCFDLAPRGAYVDHLRIFFDGARIFLAVDGEEEQNCIVEIIPSTLATNSDWRCMTSMPAKNTDSSGFGSYVAENHLELIDHPFEIGNFQQFEFMVHDVPHFILVSGADIADWQRLLSDVEKICQGHVDFFGELPPMPHYVFFLNVLGKGYGGIEHRASSSLLCAKTDLPVINETGLSEEYIGLLGLFSHEYFHLWNVKRIKPEVFINPNLHAEVYTKQLWIFEGITSYYDNLDLVRTKIIDANTYLKILAKDISALLQSHGGKMQTLEESSFDAWIKFYQPDENSNNSTISYYLKGSLVALTLDLLIIKNSSRRQSLADVMQVLWQQYGKNNIGLPEGHFEKIVYEVTGEDYSKFFELALRSTDPLPLAELFLEVGVLYKNISVSLTENIGLKFNSDASKLQIKTVSYASVAEQSGLAANDIIVAVNSNAVNNANFESILKRYPLDSVLKLHVLRNDMLIELEMHYPEKVMQCCELELQENMGENQELNHAKWLYA